MRRLVSSTLLILGMFRASSSEFFLHRIKSWRWNNILCEACKWDYHPVCGSDAKTYRNGCVLSCAARRKYPGLRMVYRGECNTRRYAERSLYREGCEHCRQEPESAVCGSNGVTFQNVCYFNCYREEEGDFGMGIIHPGPCLADNLTALRDFHDQVECICDSETGEGRFVEPKDVAMRFRIWAGRNVHNRHEAEGKSRKGFCEDSTRADDGFVRQIRTYNPCGCTGDEDKVCVRYRDTNATQLRKNKCYAGCEREELTHLEDCIPKGVTGLDPHCVTSLFQDVCHFDCFRSVKDPRLTYQKMRTRRRSSRRQQSNRK